MRDIVFQAEEVAQAQGALRRRCSQDARLTGETMPARLRAHPRITGESRTCRSRPLAAGSLCGAAAPREVVTEQAAERPFSLASGSSAAERYVRATEHWRRVEGAAGQRRSERLSARQQSHNPGIAV